MLIWCHQSVRAYTYRRCHFSYGGSGVQWSVLVHSRHMCLFPCGCGKTKPFLPFSLHLRGSECKGHSELWAAGSQKTCVHSDKCPHVLRCVRTAVFVLPAVFCSRWGRCRSDFPDLSAYSTAAPGQNKLLHGTTNRDREKNINKEWKHCYNSNTINPVYSFKTCSWVIELFFFINKPPFKCLGSVIFPFSWRY